MAHNAEIAVKTAIKNAVQGYILAVPQFENPNPLARVVVEAVLRLSHNEDGTVIDENPIEEIGHYSYEQLFEWVIEAIKTAKESLPPERMKNLMTRRYIKVCDAFAPARKIEMGTELEIVKEKEDLDTLIELENGAWLKRCNDGRYWNSEDELERWATVQIIEEDETGEFLGAELLGYAKL